MIWEVWKIAIKPKYGHVSISRGYPTITNGKYADQLLHRLVFEDYHGCKLDSTDVIHHIDGNKLNCHPTNLICMSRGAHARLHNSFNNPFYGKQHSQESRKKMKENHADVSGENNPRYRDDIPTGEDLLREYEAGTSHRKLAEKYNCNQSTISRRIKKTRELVGYEVSNDMEPASQSTLEDY